MKDYPHVFNIFDTLAYVSIGFLFWIIVLVLVRAPSEPVHIPPTLSSSHILIPLALLVSYVSGHVFAHFSSLLLEKVIVGRWLQYPSVNFFSTIMNDSSPGTGRLFTGYRSAYPEELAVRIRDAYESISSRKFSHHEAYLFCFHYVKQHSAVTYNRLLTFIQLYAFCRNISMMFLVLAAICLVSAIAGPLSLLPLTTIPFLLFYIFFSRYLKFFRVYGEEVFRSFLMLSLSHRSS